MDESTRTVDELIHAFARAETLAVLPPVVDVLRVAPPNPPESVQAAFVGSSYLTAYADAASFVRVADQWSERHRSQGLAASRLIVDFGSGWAASPGSCSPTFGRVPCTLSTSTCR